MAIILDDLMKTLGSAYVLMTYFHQPYVGAVYGKMLQVLEDRIKDPGTYKEDVAAQIMQQNISTMRTLLQREVEQLRSEGYDVVLKRKKEEEH